MCERVVGQISNGRTSANRTGGSGPTYGQRTGPDEYGRYSWTYSYSAGQQGSHTENSSGWWGLNDITNNVISILNNNVGTVVQVTDLDRYTHRHRWLNTNLSGTVTSTSTVRDVDAPAPGVSDFTAWNSTPSQSGGTRTVWNEADHRFLNNNTQDVTVGAGLTTHLQTLMNPATVTGAAGDATGWTPGTISPESRPGYYTGHFEITNMTKLGTGTLSLEIQNLEITNFTGTAGTLQLAYSDTGVLAQGTLTSTRVWLNGGRSMTAPWPGVFPTHPIEDAGSVEASEEALANFTFTSTAGTGSTRDQHRWTIGTIGAALDTTNPGGLNNYGYIDVTDNAFLNSVTNVGRDGEAAELNIGGNATIGDIAGTHILNVRSGGTFEVWGAFSAGTVADSDVYINDVWGGKFITHGAVNLATHADSRVIQSVSKTERIHNIGDYVVGATGLVILNLYTTGTDGTGSPAREMRHWNDEADAGILRSTATAGNIIFARDEDSSGSGWFHGEHSGLFQESTAQAVIIGQRGKGEVDIYDFAKMFTNGRLNANGGLIIADKATSEGRLDVFDDGRAQSLGDMFVAREVTFNPLTGAEIARAEGTLNVYTNYAADRPDYPNNLPGDTPLGKGIMEVGDSANLSNLTLAEAGTGTANIYHWGELRVWGNMTVAEQVHLDAAGDEELGRAIGTLNVYDNARTEVGYATAGTGNMILAEHGTGTANIYDDSTLQVWGNMTVANKVDLNDDGDEEVSRAMGTLNVHTRSTATVGGQNFRNNMILADEGTGTANIYNNSTLRVWGNMTVADKVTRDTSGDEVSRPIGNLNIYNNSNTTVGALIGSVNSGNLILGNEGTATAQVYDNSMLTVFGNVTTAAKTGSQGSMFVRDNSQVSVHGNHTIAGEAGSVGWEAYDGGGTSLTVTGTLTVGNNGFA